MTDDEVQVVFESFEEEMARLYAAVSDEDGNAAVTALLDRVNGNTVIARDSDLAWWKKIAWLNNVRLGVYGLIGQFTVQEWIAEGMEL